MKRNLTIPFEEDIDKLIGYFMELRYEVIKSNSEDKKIENKIENFLSLTNVTDKDFTKKFNILKRSFLFRGDYSQQLKDLLIYLYPSVEETLLDTLIKKRLYGN